MLYSCCSGNFSSHSLGSCVRYPWSSRGSSSPGHLVYSTGLCSPRACQWGSSLYKGCQETRCVPSSCQPSCVVSRSCWPSCCLPRTSVLCSPCQRSYPGGQGFGCRSSCSLGCGPRRCCSPSCGSSGFRPLSYRVRGFPSLGSGSRSRYLWGCRLSDFRSLGCGARGFSSLGHGSESYRPPYLTFRTCQSSCSRPACGSGFY